MEKDNLKLKPGKPRKDGISLNCYVQKDIILRLEKMRENTGLSKTKIVERALDMYIDVFERTGRV